MIREITFHERIDTQSVLESELDLALESKSDMIVIEPNRLGEETLRWIQLGDCLSRTCIVSGFSSVVCCVLWEDKPYFYTPLTGLSIFCASFYEVSWRPDPCSCYRQAKDDEDEVQDKAQNISPVTSKIILIRRQEDNKTKSIIHSTIAIISLSFSVWKLYRWIRFVV